MTAPESNAIIADQITSTVVITMLAYVATVTPGTWFPRQDPVAWSARQMALVRGAGRLVGDELIETSSGADGSVLISLETDLRSDQYPGIAWSAIDIPEGAAVRPLWRNDVPPGRLSTTKIIVESGRPLPAVLAGNPAWIGRIKGLALLVATRLDKPMHVRGVVAKPMGAFDVLGDRFRERRVDQRGHRRCRSAGPAAACTRRGHRRADHWIWFGWTRMARHPVAWLPFAIVGVFVAGSAILDARHTWNLVRQVADTAARYKGMDWREKHRAAEDGELCAFVEKARAALRPLTIIVAGGLLYPFVVFAFPAAQGWAGDPVTANRTVLVVGPLLCVLIVLIVHASALECVRQRAAVPAAASGL